MSLREQISRLIHEEEQKLINKYKGKFIISRIYSKKLRFESPILRFSTVFKIENINFKKYPVDSENFLKYVVISGVDELGHKRFTTKEVDKIEVSDSAEPLKLILALEKK